uniref:Neur_chan_LBD domain-containing protein n=1 Tax=Meloidogyne hapla TaxID=6305 RepID=A0A1I8BIQ0_MELHA
SSLGRGVDLRLPYRFIPNNLIIENRFRRSQPMLPPLIADQSSVIGYDFSLEPFIVSTWEDGKRRRK